MKRNFLVAVAIALAALLGVEFSDSHAQTTNTPGAAPAPAVQPTPGMPPAPRPPMPRRPMGGPAMMYQRAVSSLRSAKIGLQRSEGDLGGHKQSAMDACDKAIEELSAVIKALPPMPQAAPRPQPGTPAQPAPSAPPAPAPQQTPPAQ